MKHTPSSRERHMLFAYNVIVRRYNEETKFPVTPSFVLTHSSDSIFRIFNVVVKIEKDKTKM